MELRRIDLADGAAAEALLELQRRAYRVEADLIGSDDIPPLNDSLAELQACEETFLGAYDGDGLAGAVSWRLEDGTIDLHRLVVDPGRFRQGIGRLLVQGALAAEPGAVRAVVQTGAANEPAKTLYEREGFAELDTVEPAPGIRVTRFARSLRTSR